MSAASNVRWVLLSQGVRVLAQVIGVTVLAHLLPPESYGVLALATIVTNLATLFRDMGSSAAIIQAKVLTKSLTDTVHWANVALGLILGFTVIAVAPLMVHVFHERELTRILLLLACVFPITSFSIVHQALLERESRFRVVVMAEVLAAIVGLALAMLAAMYGAGVYSLVLQVVATALVCSITILLRSTFRPSWAWNRQAFFSIVGFSGNLSLFNLVNYLARNADSMVIGRLLGTVPLGIYSLAYRIMLLPVQNLTFVSSRALFPVMSRRSDQPDEVAELYLKSVGLIAFISAPLMACAWALRDLLVDVVLGPNWHAVAGVLAWLAPVGFIQSIVSTTGTISMARGRTDLLLRLGLLGAALQVSAFVIGSRWGIEGVAACYLIANVLNALPACHYSFGLIAVSMVRVLTRIIPTLTISTVMALLLTLTRHVESHFVLTQAVQLLILLIVGTAFYALASIVLNKAQWSLVLATLKRPQHRTPDNA